MIGAIAGDVIGSLYEGDDPQEKDFPLFSPYSCYTDDTVLAVAVASAIRRGENYERAVRRWARRYPNAGYGPGFYIWLMDDHSPPYGSYGNGSAMRVAAIGWAYDDPEAVLREATRSAEFTHNHPEGIKGAQAVAFLESTDFEDAVRNAVSFGGDTDTAACIAGAMAEAFYGRVPDAIQAEVFSRLDRRLRAEVVAFARTYNVPIVDGADAGVEHWWQRFPVRR